MYSIYDAFPKCLSTAVDILKECRKWIEGYTGEKILKARFRERERVSEIERTFIVERHAILSICQFTDKRKKFDVTRPCVCLGPSSCSK